MFQPDEHDKVELPALEQLQGLGWTYLPGADLSPEASTERQYYRDVVLEHRLTAAIQRINPWISEENLRKVVRDLHVEGKGHPTLMETNQTLWETLVQYLSVEQDLGKGRKGQTVKIIDFDKPDNNDFLCVNQFKVEALAIQKSRWIREKLLLQREHQPPKPKEYVPGECFTYLGRNYRLKVESGPSRSVKLKNGRLVVQVPPSVQKRDQYVQDTLTEWYRAHALEKLQEKVERYSKLVRVSPSSVGIKTFKGRWGSCSNKGNMEFNWKIIIAPNHIVDYVVVHELCHLHHHNHSPEFWQCVGRVFPDYQESKDWLKVNGRLLDI